MALITSSGKIMTILDKNTLCMYPGWSCFPIRPPAPEPQPIMRYGVIRPMYAVPVR
jgi:hypothetical protein